MYLCFLLTCLVLADQLGSGNRSPWIFFRRAPGTHLSMIPPETGLLGESQKFSATLRECNMVPWWCECPLQKITWRPHKYSTSAQSYFSDWRLFLEGNRKLSSWRPQKDSEISLKMPNILSLEIRFKNHGIKMPIKCQSPSFRRIQTNSALVRTSSPLIAPLRPSPLQSWLVVPWVLHVLRSVLPLGAPAFRIAFVPFPPRFRGKGLPPTKFGA